MAVEGLGGAVRKGEPHGVLCCRGVVEGEVRCRGEPHLPGGSHLGLSIVFFFLHHVEHPGCDGPCHPGEETLHGFMVWQLCARTPLGVLGLEMWLHMSMTSTGAAEWRSVGRMSSCTECPSTGGRLWVVDCR